MSTIETVVINDAQYDNVLSRLQVGFNYSHLKKSLLADPALNSPARKQQAVAAMNLELIETGALLERMESEGLYNVTQVKSWGQMLFLSDKEALGCLPAIQEAAKKHQGYLLLGLSLIGLALNCVAMFPGEGGFAHDVVLPLDSSGGHALRSMNIISCIRKGIAQCKHGDIRLGASNLLAASGLLASTLTLVIGSLALGTVAVSSSLAMIGGAMFFAQLLGAAIEWTEVQRTQQRIIFLKDQIQQEQSPLQKMRLQKLLLLEAASLHDHKMLFNQYLTTALVMTVVSIISFSLLSGVTFGALPATTFLAVCVGLLLTALKRGVLSADAKDNLFDAAHDPHKQASGLDTWIKIQASSVQDDGTHQLNMLDETTLDLDKPVTIKNGILASRQVSFQTYIDELLIKFPKKGLAIIDALEARSTSALETAVAMKRHRLSTSPTVGQLLLSDIAIKDEEAVDSKEDLPYCETATI